VFVTQEARKGVERPFAFRSYSLEDPKSLRSRNAECDTTQASVVDACRASLSSPTSFHGVRVGKYGTFLDASASRLSPVLEAYNEIRESHSAEIQCFVTIGSNFSHSPLGTSDASTKRQMAGADAYLVSESKSHGFPYRRFAVADLSDEYRIPDIEASIAATRKQARYYCDDPRVKTHLRNWARRLVRYRLLRAKTVRWNKYAGFEVSQPDTGEGVRHSRAQVTFGE
jgi:hypothetical protein